MLKDVSLKVCAIVLHSITPYDGTVIVSQIELPSASMMSIPDEETVAPGAAAIRRVPPIDPEFGVTETSYGVILI